MTRKHRFFWALFRPLVSIFLKLKFDYKYEIPEDLPDNYIVLSNHTTDYDPMLVGVCFRRQMYFVASEHITRWGLPYKLLNFAFEPIIRYKGTVATSTVLDILRKVRKGARVCIFAEGMKSWDGVTCSILPSTAQMIKKSGAALVTYRLTGGYFVSPAWSEGKPRKGRLCGAVVGVYTKEQLAEMSYEEIDRIIKNDLYEDAYERQIQFPEIYKGKNRAKGLENIFYICPKCKGRDVLYTEGNSLLCSKCRNSIIYDLSGMLEGCPPYYTVRDLLIWQSELLAQDVRAGEAYRTEGVKCFNIDNGLAELVCEGELIFTPTALSINGQSFELTELTDLAIHGRHALVFEASKKYYELILPKGACTYKYLQYYREALSIAKVDMR